MKLLLLILIAVLAACTPESNITPTMDRTNQDINMRVIFYDTKSDLADAYRQVNKLPPNTEVPDQWGFAAWNEQRTPEGILIDTEQKTCVIHTFQPKRQNDRLVLTMGHELLHCIYGSYHK